jgi:hypothetical protein
VYRFMSSRPFCQLPPGPMGLFAGSSRRQFSEGGNPVAASQAIQGVCVLGLERETARNRRATLCGLHNRSGVRRTVITRGAM